MALSTLPDLCLLTILNRIPLYDLLATVNRVCHRWETMRPIACHRRRSLILVQDRTTFNCVLTQTPYTSNDRLLREITNDDGTPYYRPNLDNLFEYNSLVMSNLSDQVCQKLVTILPNISSFQFGHYSTLWSTQIEHIKYLFQGWSSKLVHLNIHLRTTHYIVYNNNEKPDEYILDSLFNQINLLSNLKIFKIMLQLHMNCSHKLTTKLQFLSHLEQFDYMDDTETFYQHIIDNLEDALKDSSNCALKRISLGTNWTLPPVWQYSAALSARLTHCWLIRTPVNLGQLRLASLSLKSLEILSIRNFESTDISYVEFISVLSNLTQLIVLELKRFPQTFLPTSKINPDHQIPSIKALDISFSYPLSHNHIDNLSFTKTFPNLQVIQLAHRSDQCAECGYDVSELGPELYDKPQIRECHRQIVKPLKQCTKVGNIYLRQVARYQAPIAPVAHIYELDNVFTIDQL